MENKQLTKVIGFGILSVFFLGTAPVTQADVDTAYCLGQRPAQDPLVGDGPGVGDAPNDGSTPLPIVAGCYNGQLDGPGDSDNFRRQGAPAMISFWVEPINGCLNLTLVNPPHQPWGGGPICSYLPLEIISGPQLDLRFYDARQDEPLTYYFAFNG